MTWFKVDDKLHSHKKTMKAGVQAMGLWVIAGSWCADQLADGFIPDYVADSLDPNYEVHAAALVRAGLWVEEKRDDEVGWLFHDWEDQQPTKAKVMDDRRKTAERVQKWRDERKGNAATSTNGNDVPDSGNDVGNGVTDTLVTPPPTRPDPTRPVNNPQPSVVGPRKRGTRIPDDFEVTDEMVTWARQHVPHVDGRLETEKFVNYWHAKTGRDATKLDWPATWRNWMLNAHTRAPLRAITGRPTAGGFDFDSAMARALDREAAS